VTDIVAVVESSRRGRGRPRAGDPEEISEIALRLINERGYSATTMTDIAEAAGISAPTLFRYFPSKSSVLWHGMEDSTRLFREACRAQDPGMPLVDAVIAGYFDMLRASPVRIGVIKNRVAIVSRQGEAPDAAWLRHEEWTNMVVELVAERRKIPVDGLEATTIGAMIWSALWAAITAWAASDESEPSRFIDAVRRYIVIPE
jgi:AcrR family transcriptional regulator